MSKPAFLLGPDLDGKPHRWELNQDEFTIGRKAPADLVLPFSRVSRLHAKITRAQKGYFIEDLGSRNGTFVNGNPVGGRPHRLFGGDEIVFGGTVVLHFDDPDETAAGPMIGRLTGVWIDPATRSVWVDARPVNPPLSQAQFALLALLYRREGQVIPRAAIIAAVWPDVDPAGVSSEAVNALLKRLRKRLRETQTQETEYIEVLRGHGVRLVGGK